MNLSDALLMGSADSIELMPEVITRYQLQFNHMKLYQDAFLACKQNKKCSSVVNELDSTILNQMMKTKIENLSTKPRNKTEWDKANAEIEKLSVIARNKSSLEWFKVVDEYYYDEIIDLK